jgi:hypothetical protein
LREWVTELRQKAMADIVIAIAGNKCDLQAQRAVSTAEAQEFADSMNAEFLETSARAATNVYQLFERIGYLALFIYLFIHMSFLKQLLSCQGANCPRRWCHWGRQEILLT